MADYQGGFMPQNDMSDGLGSQGNAAAAAGGVGGPSPPRKMRDNKTLTPVTLKQLADAKAAPDDTFKIDGADVSQVSFVALIRQMTVQATNINYQVSGAPPLPPTSPHAPPPC
jgi:replication factor A2